MSKLCISGAASKRSMAAGRRAPHLSAESQNRDGDSVNLAGEQLCP